MSLLSLFKTATKSPRTQKPLSYDLISTPQCDECESHYATRYCPVCTTNQCDDCLDKLHSVKRRQGHAQMYQNCFVRKTEKVVFTNRDAQITIHPESSEKCRIHCDVGISGFCRTCHVLVCDKCSKDAHLNHEILARKDAILDLTGVTRTYSKDIERQLNDIKECKTEICEHSLALEKSYFDCKGMATEFFDTLLHAIEAKKATILKDLDTNHDKNMGYIQNIVSDYDFLIKSELDIQSVQTVQKAYELGLAKSFDISQTANSVLKFIPRIPPTQQISCGYEFQGDPKLVKEFHALKLKIEKNFQLKERLSQVDPEKCTVSGCGIKYATLGKDAKFLIQVRDKDGKAVRISPDSIGVTIVGKDKISPIINVKSIGSYSVKYKPASIGEVKISIEIGNVKLPQSPFTVAIEPVNTIELTRNTNFDTNGLFYYMGMLNRKKYDNPMIRGQCEVTSSSISPFSTKYFTVVDVQPSNFYTQGGDTELWCQVSIVGSGYVFQPNYYCIRNGSGLSEYAMRNWKLEGSNDRKFWSLIKQHFDDTSIQTKKSAVAGWELDAIEYYSYFRITATGVDASGEHNLCIGGVEFYGSLKKSSIKV